MDSANACGALGRRFESDRARFLGIISNFLNVKIRIQPRIKPEIMKNLPCCTQIFPNHFVILIYKENMF